MTEADRLIKEFLAKGGKVTKVPDQNFRRKDFEAPVLKKRRMMADLVERAKQVDNA